MVDIILDTLLDSIKLIPFLYLTFFVMELLEHKFSEKSDVAMQKSGKLGPLFGGILGGFPQCGFAVGATNLYARRIISVGTLIAVYLSTSDEMLPILISRQVDISVMLKIVGLKMLIGVAFGFAIDFLLRNKPIDKHSDIHDFCEKEHCHCEDKIWFSTLKHTLNIIFFITLVTFLLNSVIYYFSEESIKRIFLLNSFLAPFLSGLIGLIPNCAASVVLTELYLSGTITLGSAMAGLLSGSGVALLVLFKVNENKKTSFKILLSMYAIGVACGIIIDFFSIML